jgi:hypothetical protein
MQLPRRIVRALPMSFAVGDLPSLRSQIGWLRGQLQLDFVLGRRRVAVAALGSVLATITSISTTLFMLAENCRSGHFAGRVLTPRRQSQPTSRERRALLCAGCVPRAGGRARPTLNEVHLRCRRPGGGTPGVVTPTAGLTGMMVTVRVADFGLTSTVPKAKPLSARRRRRKCWALRPFSLIFERI